MDINKQLLQLAERDALKHEISGLRQQLEAAEAKLQREEDSHSKTIADRDYYHEVADKLAQGIAEHFRVELCEHSSDECPWTMALEILNGEYVTDSDEKRQLATVEAALAAADAARHEAWEASIAADEARHTAIAERDRAVKDAERYRWLRDRVCATAAGFSFTELPRLPANWRNGSILQHFDAAIAAAAGDAGGDHG